MHKLMPNRSIHPISEQRGATLAIVLIFLVLVTLIGVTAMTTTTLEEKMSGNLKEQNLAFQAAESALRDAKLDILGLNVAGAISPTGRTPPISGETGFGDGTDTRPSCSSTGSTLGLCATAGTSFAAAALDSTNILAQNFTGAPSVEYGTFTGAPALSDVAIQPRYIIEAVNVRPQGNTGKLIWYRITARGYGARLESQATIQEVFRLE
jgi:type IV pilus assembly protein PilX